ncbi:MAG: 4Fe-4S binding protein [Clostridia bacterium]|nr:4Fe-4S binding protein [Clostridia bacterium]
MKKIFRFRGWIQAGTALLTNANLTGFLSGKIYTGPLKNACVPGLNCYSCPGALGSCPIGALQAVAGGQKHNLSFYVVGILLLFGMLFGRLICGFLCPFGWIQQLLNKIPGKKLRIPDKLDRRARLLKYGVLAIAVLALPAFLVDDFGLGAPYFCKWICPAGTLEGGIPLVLANESLRSSLGFLFWWKMGLLIATIVLSILIYRPFCKYVCPLGAFYALLNRISLTRMELDRESCISCGKCVRACPMQVQVLKDINSSECIRCGKCAQECPTGAIDIRFGKVTLKGMDAQGSALRTRQEG